MFRSTISKVEENLSIKYELFNDDMPLSFGNFLKELQTNDGFRSFFINLLGDVPFHAYQWETPPVSTETINQPFEFVVHNSPHIDLPPNRAPFKQYFADLSNERQIAVFDNLGGDARLIAPAALGQKRNYSHIGVFTKLAPEKQQHALWQTVGNVTDEQISGQPLWLNTAGGGVAWLHVRLDSRPKYYRHNPYR